jgi:[acyl-carrier-protein] S-malonyltransferase
VVISGEIAAIDRACDLARARGARRAIRLEVSGAFHSPLMASAGRGLEQALDAITLRDARCPIIANISAEPVRTAAEIRAALARQLLGAVRWERSMRRLIGEGVHFIELGAGAVLRGLLRTLDRQVVSWNVEDPDTLQATLAGLESGALPAVGKES